MVDQNAVLYSPSIQQAHIDPLHHIHMKGSYYSMVNFFPLSQLSIYQRKDKEGLLTDENGIKSGVISSVSRSSVV